LLFPLRKQHTGRLLLFSETVAVYFVNLKATKMCDFALKLAVLLHMVTSNLSMM